MLEDLRFALRQCLKAPAFTITAVLTLALGIGANTAIFSVVNAVLRHPAGVDHPERLAVINARYTQFGLDLPVVSVPDYADAASLHSLVEAAAIEQSTSFNIERDGIAQHLRAARVSSQWFRVFGARPILGRTFTAEEDQPSAGPVVVLSYGLWRQVFGGARDAAGRSLVLDGKSYRVIGVMRSDFDWPRADQMWIPIALPPTAFAAGQRFNENYMAIARLRPGVSVNALSAGLAQKMREELRRNFSNGFGAKAGWSMYAAPLAVTAAGPLRKPLYVLFGVVALVLLIAAANVAGLFLARSSARSREFAIRTALGASSARMVRQLFLETALLAGTAAALGIAAGPLLGRLLLLMVPQDLAEGFTIHMEASVLAFTAGVALVSSLIAGVGPAFRLARRQDMLQLREGGRSATASVEKQRLRSAFVIGEVALAFLLLSGTGLFLASLRQLQRVDPGFNPHGVVAGKVFYSGQDFKTSQPRQGAFVQSVVTNLAAQPGVQAAAAIQPLPFEPDGIEAGSFEIEGGPAGSSEATPHSGINLATAGYLKVLQIPLLAGRWLTDDDRAGTQPVVVIDQRLARHYWPNQNPVGQHIRDGNDEPWRTIVGVVANIRSSSLEEATGDGMRYEPFAQGEDSMANFLVRSEGDPGRAVSLLGNAVHAVDPTQAVGETVPLAMLVENSLAGRRLIVDMLAAFAGLALLLAVIGIYGLISYITAQRTGEVGVRMALGAQRSDVVRLVLSGVLRWIGVGLVFGIALSVAATALLRHLYADFGVGIAASLACAVAALLVVGGFAGLLPARRAASIDPAQALRSE